MRVKVKQKNVTLHCKDGTDITLQDADDHIASLALGELQRGRLIDLGDGEKLAPKSVMYAKIESVDGWKCIPPICPSDCSTLEPPTIYAPTEPLEIEVGEEFDPLGGVSAFDGNCKELTVTVTLEERED